MKKGLFLFIIIFLFPLNAFAQRGCCSHHGGVCGCNKNGRTICCDNTLSPSCTCNPPKVNGCTDSKADNYNPDANHDDGYCTYSIKEDTVGIVNNNLNKKTSNLQSNQKDNNINGTNNDTGTLLFYLTTILGGAGYGIYKKSIKK